MSKGQRLGRDVNQLVGVLLPYAESIISQMQRGGVQDLRGAVSILLSDDPCEFQGEVEVMRALVTIAGNEAVVERALHRAFDLVLALT